jgi:AraC-like DNA-binding protein
MVRYCSEVDVLADVLATTRLGSVLLAQLRTRGSDWGCAMERQDTAAFHVVAEGVCWLRTAGQPPIQMLPGDSVLLLHGQQHSLTGTADGPAVPFSELTAAYTPGPDGVLDLGGAGPAIRVICGKFRYNGDRPHPVLSALPAVIHVPGATADAELRSVVHLLAAEMRDDRPGARAVATRLTDVLFVQMLRVWMAQGEAGRSWLTALADPRIGTALSQLHDSPQNPWTVDDLAHGVSMSRPAFARHFKTLVGVSPLAYLSRLRIDTAARLLRETDEPVARIAGAVGYTSEFAFSRAFSRECGVAPGRYRRTAKVQTDR